MITPIEIKKIDFSKTLRGYSVDEVNSILEIIVQTLEKHVSEKTELQSKIKILQAKLESFQQLESSIQESALMMQNLIEEKKKDANREAQIIIDEAYNKAFAQKNDYEDQMNQLKKDINYLRSQRKDYFIKFRHFVNSQKDWLEAMDES